MDLCLAQVGDAMTSWFAENPERRKMDVRDLRSACGLETGLLSALLKTLEERGELSCETGGMIVPKGREVELDDPEVARLRDLLLDWDYVLDKDSVAAAVYAT